MKIETKIVMSHEDVVKACKAYVETKHPHLSMECAAATVVARVTDEPSRRETQVEISFSEVLPRVAPRGP